MVKKIRRKATSARQTSTSEPSFDALFGADFDALFEPFEATPVSYEPHMMETPVVSLKLALQFLRSVAPDFTAQQSPHSKLRALIRRSKSIGFGEPLPKMKSFKQQYDVLQEHYLVGDPPMSPVSESFYWSWAHFDLSFSRPHKTVMQAMMDDVHLASDGFLRSFKRLQESQLGVYLYEGHHKLSDAECERYGLSSGAVTLELTELVTGCEVSVILDEEVLFERGMRLLLRLAQLPAPENTSPTQRPLYLSLCTAYVLRSSEQAWRSYFQRALTQPHAQGVTTYESLMRSEQAPLLWLEYLHCAYAGDTMSEGRDRLVIFLEGVPDEIDSMPEGEQADHSFLGL